MTFCFQLEASTGQTDRQR